MNGTNKVTEGKYSIKPLKNWLKTGEKKGYIINDEIQLNNESEEFPYWLLYGKQNRLITPKEIGISKEALEELQRHFRQVLVFLVVLILLSSIYLILVGADIWPEHLILLAGVSGLLGSSIAALVSALNRHAQGYEDKFGNAMPEPEKSKERFTHGMYYWFLCRPLLGIFVGILVWWGLNANLLNIQISINQNTLGFVTGLSGFLAKSFLEVLKGVFKNIFRT